MGEDGTDADGILVSPVHAGLLAPSNNEDSGGGLNMSGSYEKAFLSESSVAHVFLALPDVVQRLFGFGGSVQRLRIFVFEAFDDRNPLSGQRQLHHPIGDNYTSPV